MKMNEKLKEIYGEPIRFSDGKEMLCAISEKNYDLYCPEKETYVFCYNAVGSIAVYDWIDDEECENLIKFQENACGEYWGAALGPGGNIYDDANYSEENETPSLTGESLEWCNDNFDGEWFIVCEN